MRINIEYNFFDAINCIINNLQNPIEETDAINKQYIDHKLPDSSTELGCCDFKNNRLVNVAKPENDDDAVMLKIIKDLFTNYEKTIEMLYTLYINVAKDTLVKSKDEFFIVYILY